MDYDVKIIELREELHRLPERMRDALAQGNVDEWGRLNFRREQIPLETRRVEIARVRDEITRHTTEIHRCDQEIDRLMPAYDKARTAFETARARWEEVQVPMRDLGEARRIARDTVQDLQRKLRTLESAEAVEVRPDGALVTTRR